MVRKGSHLNGTQHSSSCHVPEGALCAVMCLAEEAVNEGFCPSYDCLPC